MIKNVLSLEETLEQLRDYLSRTKNQEGLDLLAKAQEKSLTDEGYTEEMRQALENGSTIQYRQLFSCFGDYWDELSPYTHTNAVNAIDSAMLHIKRDEMEIAIEFYNFLHNGGKIVNEERMDKWLGRGDVNTSL